MSSCVLVGILCSAAGVMVTTVVYTIVGKWFGY